ncbi:MAG: hypothetical protein AVDCRST_MAG06-992 [uncultured Nocardioides sp.]|uniref:Uncharacterized protein n=1 Tax=uncultured Nocardioides sp. TaxID=198441 RepID=A0A6J4NBQ5_9ACTN|nr:MAG: hypothetical protein AVDCRST_MAG06-992 [uncultured Nocardioides sp.]
MAPPSTPRPVPGSAADPVPADDEGLQRLVRTGASLHPDLQASRRCAVPARPGPPPRLARSAGSRPLRAERAGRGSEDHRDRECRDRHQDETRGDAGDQQRGPDEEDRFRLRRTCSVSS